jgi:hypothetical protein
MAHVGALENGMVTAKNLSSTWLAGQLISAAAAISRKIFPVYEGMAH